MFRTLVPILLSAVSLASTIPSATIQTYLKDHLSSGSEVFLPSESAYATELTERWNAYDAPTYIVGVKPATVEDVSIIVCRIYVTMSWFRIH